MEVLSEETDDSMMEMDTSTGFNEVLYTRNIYVKNSTVILIWIRNLLS